MESRPPFSPALKILSDVIGNQIREHLLKMFMEDGSAPCPDLGLAVAPVLIVVFEDRKGREPQLRAIFEENRRVDTFSRLRAKR